MTRSSDWASGPARWGAAAILGGAGLFGVARGVFSDRVYDPIRPTVTATTMVESPGERSSTPVQAADERAAVVPSGGPYDSLAGSTGDPPSDAADRPTDGAPPSLSVDDDIGVRIAINRAPSGELQLLPRIGPVLAQRIVDDRTANGPFASLADLQRVRGIGPKTAEQLEPLIRFD